ITSASHYCYYSYAFFFFQAEDGIRDSSVTGVQTCALPISDAAPNLPDLILIDGGRGQLGAASAELEKLGLGHIPILGLAKEFERSEERRVGKGCRYRWAGDDEKRKG